MSFLLAPTGMKGVFVRVRELYILNGGRSELCSAAGCFQGGCSRVEAIALASLVRRSHEKFAFKARRRDRRVRGRTENINESMAQKATTGMKAVSQSAEAE